jgi:hypothetical protein
MYCPACGALNDSSLLCMTCGRELSSPAPAPKRPEPETPAETPPATDAPAPTPAAAPIEHACPVHPELPVGGTCSRCGKFVCIRCAPRLAEGDSLCSDCAGRQMQSSDSEGIGGWLVLPAIGLVLTSLAGGFIVVLGLFSGAFEEVAIGALLGATGLFASYNFFTRKRHAPLIMVGFYVLGIVVNVAQARGYTSIIWSVLWIFYFLTSERVKRTFVK